MNAAELLPANRRPWEVACAAAMSDTLPVPIAAAFDPARTPVALLPWLAVHDGVRLWFSDWSEARRRQVVAEAPLAAWEVGLRSGSIRYLGYVDADLIDVVAYPTRFVMGRARIGRTPIGHPPHLARHLVRVVTHAPSRALVLGRSALGRSRAVTAPIATMSDPMERGPVSGARLRTPAREPFRRCLVALRTAKAPETEYRVDFAHRRPLRLSDAPLLDGSTHLGAFVARNKL